MAELSQVLRCSTSQAVARDGIELEMDTETDWKPMEVPSNCRRDRIVFADFEDQTCSRVEDRLETVKEIRACPIEEAVCKIDACADEGVDFLDGSLDGVWMAVCVSECRTVAQRAIRSYPCPFYGQK